MPNIELIHKFLEGSPNQIVAAVTNHNQLQAHLNPITNFLVELMDSAPATHNGTLLSADLGTLLNLLKLIEPTDYTASVRHSTDTLSLNVIPRVQSMEIGPADTIWGASYRPQLMTQLRTYLLILSSPRDQPLSPQESKFLVTFDSLPFWIDSNLASSITGSLQMSDCPSPSSSRSASSSTSNSPLNSGNTSSTSTSSATLREPSPLTRALSANSVAASLVKQRGCHMVTHIGDLYFKTASENYPVNQGHEHAAGCFERLISPTETSFVPQTCLMKIHSEAPQYFQVSAAIPGVKLRSILSALDLKVHFGESWEQFLESDDFSKLFITRRKESPDREKKSPASEFIAKRIEKLPSAIGEQIESFSTNLGDILETLVSRNTMKLFFKLLKDELLCPSALTSKDDLRDILTGLSALRQLRVLFKTEENVRAFLLADDPWSWFCQTTTGVQIIKAMMLIMSDDKSDNLMVMPLNAYNKLTIVGFDHEEGFASPPLYRRSGTSKVLNRLRSTMLALPFMQQTIPDTLLEIIRQKKPGPFCLKLIEKMKEKSDATDALFVRAADVTPDEGTKLLNLPYRFSQQFIQWLHQTYSALFNYCSSIDADLSLTYEDLFRHLFPIIHREYKERYTIPLMIRREDSIFFSAKKAVNDLMTDKEKADVPIHDEAGLLFLEWDDLSAFVVMNCMKTPGRRESDSSSGSSTASRRESNDRSSPTRTMLGGLFKTPSFLRLSLQQSTQHTSPRASQTDQPAAPSVNSPRRLAARDQTSPPIDIAPSRPLIARRHTSGSTQPIRRQPRLTLSGERGISQGHQQISVETANTPEASTPQGPQTPGATSK